MISEFINTIASLFSDDSYYTVGNKPIIMITPSNLSSSAMKSIDYSIVILKLKEVMSEIGHELYIIGELTTSWVVLVNYEDQQIYSFDGITANDWSTNMYDRFYSFFSFVDFNWANWKRTFSDRGVNFISCIFPSYNDRINSTSSYKYTFGQDGNTDDYIIFCNVAKRNIGKENIILINS